MAATAKTAYTADQTAQLVETYTAADSADARDAIVAEMAAEFGKSIKSVIAKLSREGVYVKKVPTRKDGTAVIKKDDVADRIGEILNLSEPDTASLSKANRKALIAIRDFMEEAADNMINMAEEIDILQD